MTKNNIEKLKLHNKNTMSKSAHWIGLSRSYYLAKGWVDALNYITNNYNLEEK